jgi:hypothetical protein
VLDHPGARGVVLGADDTDLVDPAREEHAGGRRDDQHRGEQGDDLRR